MNSRDLTFADYAGIALCIFMLAVVFPSACEKEREYQRMDSIMSGIDQVGAKPR